MTNNDLLSLYNLEKSSYDSYSFWKSVAICIWVIINSVPRIFDLSLSKPTSFSLWLSSLLLLLILVFLNIQKAQSNKRMDQIMKILLIKNP